MERLPPELLQIIFSFLCPHCCQPKDRQLDEYRYIGPELEYSIDLVSLSLTCRKLGDIAQATLFHMAADIPLLEPRGRAEARFYRTILERPDLAKHVHQFTVAASFWPKLFPDDEDVGMEAGDRGQVDDDEEEDEDDEEEDDGGDYGRIPRDNEAAVARLNHVEKFLSLFPNLQDLYFMPIDFWNPDRFDLDDSLARMCKTVGFQNVKRMQTATDVFFGLNVGYSAINTIVPLLPSGLTHLRIRGGPSLSMVTNVDIPAATVLPNLTNLRLQQWDMSDLDANRDHCVLQLLRCCPKLQTFKFNLSDRHSIPTYGESMEILKYLKVCSGTLRKLDISIAWPPAPGERAAEMPERVSDLASLEELRLEITSAERPATVNFIPVIGTLPGTLKKVTLDIAFPGEILEWNRVRSLANQISVSLQHVVCEFDIRLQVQDVPEKFRSKAPDIEGWELTYECGIACRGVRGVILDIKARTV